MQSGFSKNIALLNGLTTYHYKIILLLSEKERTQKQLADELGVSKQNINKVCRKLLEHDILRISRVEGHNKFLIVNYNKFKNQEFKNEFVDNTKKTLGKVSSVEVPEIGDISETITKIMYGNFNIKLTKKQANQLLTSCRSDLELFKNKVELLKNQTGVENVIGWLISALRDNFNQIEYSNINIRKRKSKINNYKGHDWDYEELEELEQQYLENSLKEGQ